jgi:peptide-methionine (R)-S-oxide reductase
LRVETLTSFTSFALGSELRCADCGGHLGDVFNDGKAFRGTPAFESGLRFRLRYSLTVL